MIDPNTIGIFGSGGKFAFCHPFIPSAGFKVYECPRLTVTGSAPLQRFNSFITIVCLKKHMITSQSNNMVQIKDLCNDGTTATLIARVKVMQGTAFKKKHRLSFYIFDDLDHVALVYVWTQNPHKLPKLNQGDLIKISNANIEIQPTPILHVNIPGSTVEKISQSRYGIPHIDKTIKNVGKLSGEQSYGRHLIICGVLEGEVEQRKKTTNEPFLKMILRGANKIKKEVILWNSILQEECMPGSKLTLHVTPRLSEVF